VPANQNQKAEAQEATPEAQEQLETLRSDKSQATIANLLKKKPSDAPADEETIEEE
jgi:hypothetical protein